MILIAVGLAWAISFEDTTENLDGAINESLTSAGSGYAGIAVFDLEGDGDLDLYLTNGPGHADTLLRNNGAGIFETANGTAGTVVDTGTRGILAADLDNDGDPDLVLVGDAANPMRILENDEGIFSDISISSGLVGAPRNVSPHAADVDGDGLLDIYLTAGATFTEHWPNLLYHNEGNLLFVDVAADAGVDTELGACAATFANFDDDDAIDLLVGNCSDLGGPDLPFELYKNRGDGTFEDVYEQSGAWALGHWMGFAVADFNGDGWLDFFSTNSGNVREQPHALYVNQQDGSFENVASAAGVADWEFGWGTVAADFDNDGDEDLYYVGKSQVGEHCASPGLLFDNRGDGSFAPPTIPLDLTEVYTSGLVAGDFDADGFVDLVVAASAAPPYDDGLAVMLRNLGNENQSLTVRLTGTSVNRDAIGARVRATTPDHRMLREISAGTSYESATTPWPTFGLGANLDARVCVHWPDGSGEDFGVLSSGAIHDLVQGDGLGDDPCGPLASATGPTTPSTVPTAPTPIGGNPVPAQCGCASAMGALSPWAALLLFLRRRR